MHSAIYSAPLTKMAAKCRFCRFLPTFLLLYLKTSRKSSCCESLADYFHNSVALLLAASEELIHPLSQVKASLALEQKRVAALRGALAETEGSDSGHSGGECESTSGDSSLEQVQLLILESSHFRQFLFSRWI